MLKDEERKTCAVFTSSSDSLVFGHKWHSQSSVRENNVTRQRKLLPFNSSTRDECDEFNEKKGYGSMKEMREKESDLMARQLASSVDSQCPLEMQSTKKLFLVNVPPPATHSTTAAAAAVATIDANVCALRHGSCEDGDDDDDEDDSRQCIELTLESPVKDADARVRNNVHRHPVAFCERATGPVNKSRVHTLYSMESQVKCDCLSPTLTDKSNQFDASEAVRYFMSNFVRRVFLGGHICRGEKATFGELCRRGDGRLWFTRYVDQERASVKQVNESTFYYLVQFFAVVLFESLEADDFAPAKSVMQMSFTYYTMSVISSSSFLAAKSCNNNEDKLYVYQCLEDQPIWKCMRFWTSSFFLSVQLEIAKSNTGRDAHSECALIHKNIAFGQLG